MYILLCLYQGTSKDGIVGAKEASLLQHDAKDKVWTQGCIDALKSWINRNLYIVAGSTLGVALMQVIKNSNKNTTD